MLQRNLQHYTHHVASETDLQHLQLLLTDRLEIFLVHVPIVMVRDLVGSMVQCYLLETGPTTV